MARIAIYNPSDTNVANRVTAYLLSANTPDYDGEPNKVVNPDLSALSAVAQKYWKYDSGGPPYIIEMTAGEKAIIDALPPVVDLQFVQQLPHTYQYEICNKDVKINTCLFDVAATLTINGVDANGHVTYTHNQTGKYGNGFTIAHVVGATGGGNESRALATSMTGRDIVVTFGTDGAGDSVVPTATAVAASVNGHASASSYVTASAGGTGASDVNSAVAANLTGGVTNSYEDLKMNPTTYLEEDWEGEFKNIGVFDNTGTICTDQIDANSNGVLSVFEYCGIDQADGITQIEWDTRGGMVYWDDSIAAGAKYDHRAYAIVAADLGQPYYVRMFDGYKGMVGTVELLESSASHLAPVAPSANSLRIFIIHPAGSKVSHIVRLITYRPTGTF